MLVALGRSGAGFAFDNEGPRHRTYLHPYALASRLVTQAEFAAFVEGGGYQNPMLWLAEGWDWRAAQGLNHPLYWHRPGGDGPWQVFTLAGLQPGATHALHVHEFGDCSAPDATSAGGHFNPGQQPHGDRATGGPHHAGDIPNQTAGDNGEAAVDQALAGLEIASGGANDIVGKGVIVHAQADDYTTQPTGNAGGRIACGVIELVNAPPADAGPAE